jgi:hypothetical protein
MLGRRLEVKDTGAQDDTTYGPPKRRWAVNVSGEHRTSAARDLERVFGEGTATALPDGEVLQRFLAARDEAAFSALLSRHGPMVLGVCRRALGTRPDADDAFQATFLISMRPSRTSRLSRAKLEITAPSNALPTRLK